VNRDDKEWIEACDYSQAVLNDLLASLRATGNLSGIIQYGPYEKARNKVADALITPSLWRKE
jgi:hypothetical protein